MKITIKEPYWTAYKRYGWEHQVWGVGINRSAIYKAIEAGDSLEIHINKTNKDYVCNPSELADFAESNKTTYKAKNTLLYVIPNTLLQKDTIDKQPKLI